MVNGIEDVDKILVVFGFVARGVRADQVVECLVEIFFSFTLILRDPTLGINIFYDFLKSLEGDSFGIDIDLNLWM